MKKMSVFTAAAGVLIFAVTFRYTQAFSEGIIIGLKNCASVIIPSLFPFMVAASFMGSVEIPERLKRIADPVTRRAFGQPSECIAAVIPALLGGYPSGAKAAYSLWSGGKISKENAKRLVLFCVNGGAGFCVNAVGTAMLGSDGAGRIILVSMCLAAVITGVFTRKKTTAEQLPQKTEYRGFSEIFVESVASASKGIITVCAYTALFSGVISVISQLGLSSNSVAAIACLLEVTSGCVEVAGKVPIPVIAAVCAFGGLCVHMQIFTLSGELKPKLSEFYFFRAIHSLLSGVICAVLLKWFPVAEETALSLSENASAWSFSAPAAISLVFLASLLILELDKEKKIC